MGKNRGEDIPCEETERYNHPTPRCSTPTFDPCVGSRRTTPAQFIADEEEVKGIERRDEGEEKALLNRRRRDRELYQEWKLRLQQGKSRLFKVRGVRNRAPSNDCSIISGHFERKVIPRPGDEATPTPTPTPAPVYQMWFPFGCPGFFTPAQNCQHQNQPWYGAAQLQHPHYHRPSTQFFTPAQYFFANLCQGYQTAQLIHCNANQHLNHYPQTHHAAHLQYRLCDPQPFANYSPIPASYPPPPHYYFHHGTNLAPFPVTMAS